MVPKAPWQYQNQGLVENEWHFLKSEDGEVSQIKMKSLRENDITLKKVKPITLTIEQLKKYTGRYYSHEINKTYRIALKKGMLGLKLYGFIHIPFQAIEGNRFLMDLIGNNTFVFQTDAAGKATGFTFNRRAITNLAFTRQN